jgi:hypothetical protein
MYATAPNEADAWFGQPVILDDATLAQIQQSLDELRATLESDVTVIPPSPEMAQLADDLSVLASRFVVTARGPDREMDGQAMAAFTTTVDLVGFLSAPELPALLVQMMSDPAFAAAVGTGEEITEEQMRFALLSLAIAFDSERTFSVEQWVGLDDHYLHRVEMLMDFSLGGELFGGTQNSMAFTLSMAARMAGFNDTSPEFVAVPADTYALERSSDFLAGGPDMIDQTLEPGQTASGTFDSMAGDARRVYAIALQAGDALIVTLDTAIFADIKICQPDGFFADQVDTTANKTARYTAAQSGLHLIVVDGLSDGPYQVTVAVE